MNTRKKSSIAKAFPSPDGKPILEFTNPAVFEDWLGRNHVDHGGFWLRIFKKDSGYSPVSYAEALDIALCYGWIDGQKRRGDAISWLQRFTRRSPRSQWSKINTRHVERLTRAGRMKPAGLAAVEAARADGRWDAAYDNSASSEMPPEFNAALAQSPRAAATFLTLNKANRYAIFYRLTTAKRHETKAKRLKELIAMLERGEKLH